MIVSKHIEQAVACLRENKVIAYPTEGVFGLGCNPFDQVAVTRLLALKQRPVTKGLILLASHVSQITPLVQPLTEEELQKITNKTRGPITWVLPISNKAPAWIVGDHASIAVRLTDFPLAVKLCEQFQQPIVSTSANPMGMAPAKTVQEVINYFDKQLAFILDGQVGSLNKPTPVRDIKTNAIIRE